MEPRNRFQGMNSSSLCSLPGRYDNPIPPRFLAPIDSLKIPALRLSLVSWLASRYCSEKIPRNRLRMISVIPGKKVHGHFEGFRGLWKSQFRSPERNWMTWKEFVFQKLTLKQIELTACFCPRYASECNSESLLLFLFHGTEFRVGSLPRNGLERSSKSLLLFLFHGTEFQTFFFSAEWFWTEFREFPVPRNSWNFAGTN